MKNCCESLVKYFMVLCNILFALAGLALIVFGAYTQIAAKDVLNFLGNSYVSTPIFIIILGGVIFVVAFFGCCGAWRENRCLIYTYGAILVIILISQVAAGIAAFVLKGDLKTEITQNMVKGLTNYNSTGYEGVTMTWDVVQKELNCCGVEDWEDWKNVTQFGDGSVPASCCIGGPVESCGAAPVNLTMIYNDGCFSLFSSEFVSNLSIVGAVAVGIAVAELVAIAFACCLGSSVGGRRGVAFLSQPNSF